MIKLVDILKELSITNYVGEIGYLWPFADSENEAEAWEESRLQSLFKGSLKDWSPHPTHPHNTILHQHDIHQTNHFKAGQASDEKIKISKGHKVVKHLYTPNEVDIYLNVDYQLDPLKKY